jgi:hypothetical protein
MRLFTALLTGYVFVTVAGVCAAQSNPNRPPTKEEMARQLDEIGRVASAMVDGDLCQRIVTKRALEFITKVDPRDRSLPGDNYDVNDEPFNRTKKTLIRLSRLVDFPCDVNLWMPVEGVPGRVQIVIRNANEMSQFWRWGALSQEMFPQMKAVLTTGKRITVTDRPGWVSVLSPIYNSLGEIVALAEVVSQQKIDLQENVK